MYKNPDPVFYSFGAVIISGLGFESLDCMMRNLLEKKKPNDPSTDYLK